MTVGRKIVAGYGAVLVLAIAIAASGLYAFERTRESFLTFTEVNQPLLTSMQEFRLGIRQQGEAYRGYLLYGGPSFLEEWREGETQYQAAMTTFTSLVSTDEDVKSVHAIESLADKWATAQRDSIELMQQGKRDEAMQINEQSVLPLRNQILEAMPPFIERQNEDFDDSRDALFTVLNRAGTTMVVFSAIAIVLSMVIAGLLTRTIARQLTEAILQMSSSATEISAMTAQLASGASETATAVSETTTTVEEVKQTANVANQKAKAVFDSAQKAASVAQGGRGAVEGTVEGIGRIREQMESIAASVVRLSEQGQAIGEIIATVDDLAEQSNLLAVNAAIEAARAGEHGKGFHVVAQEVKSLADQSKRATAQVRAILGDIQKATGAAVMATEQGSKAVDAGVRQSAEAGQAIRVLADSLAEASQAASQIAASSQQQLAGMDQVALAMENINEASAQNVAAAKQSEESANGLAALAGRLRSLIEAQRA